MTTLLVFVVAAWSSPDQGWPPIPDEPTEVHAVTDGTRVTEGWDDVVGVQNYTSTICTGTLIADDIVLTAAHCLDSTITHVVIGRKDLSSGFGERIEVAEQIPYPNWDGNYDIAILRLVDPSGATPRAIGMGCVLDYMTDQSDVTIVGYGVINYAGDESTNHLHEGFTRIDDADCDQDGFGCEANVSPGGEIAVGAYPADACFGDSGGPLYLDTPMGTYVVGVTARGYPGGNGTCGNGSVFTRPDAVIEWLEEQAGKPFTYPQCNQRPHATAAAIEARVGEPGSTQIEYTDPEATLPTYAIALNPSNGEATVSPTGEVVYTPHAGFAGTDALLIAVTDEGAGTDLIRSGAPRTIEVQVPVFVHTGACGCQTSPSAPVVAVFALGGLVFMRRRRSHSQEATH